MPCLIYVTAPSRVLSLTIAHQLVDEHLAACANIFDGATSIYRWKGEVVEDKEAVLILKTERSLVPAATARILELHSYECPCVVSFEIDGGNPAFLDWIGAEVKDAAD